MTASDALVDALLAVREGDTPAAVAAARQAGDSPLAAELVTHLETVTSQRVYDQPAAFTAFVRGGGNLTLYTRLSQALARHYDDLAPSTLLDLGCGDGLALVPALELASRAPGGIDLVEPSEALLDAAKACLGGHPGVQPWNVTAQEFFAAKADGRRWDLAQATFSLQSVPLEDRGGVLKALRARTGRLLIAEFDVPEYAEGTAEHLRSLVTRYERGIAEYGEDAHLVAQGFLLPVLLGQVAPGSVRTNWEKPAAVWAEQLADAGFGEVVVSPLADYWWSPAVLISAA
jgi:SAM-dependent methyltransferase